MHSDGNPRYTPGFQIFGTYIEDKTFLIAAKNNNYGTELHQENKPTVLGRSIHVKCIRGGQEWNGPLKSQHPRQGVIKKTQEFQGNVHFFD